MLIKLAPLQKNYFFECVVSHFLGRKKNREEEDIFAKEAVTSWLTNITFLNFLARSRDIVGTLMQSTFTDYTQYM